MVFTRMTRMNTRQRILVRCLVAVTFCALICDCAPVTAQTDDRQTPAILLGAAWYPEQWPESRWEADLALMQQAGIHMVRVGEFAWSRMEPSRRPVRSRLARPCDYSGREARHRHRHWNAFGRASRVADAEVSGNAAHHGRRPQGPARQPPAIQLCQSQISRTGAGYGRATGQALRTQSQRHRLADRQRVRRGFVRSPRPRRNSSSGSNNATGRSTTSTHAGRPRTGARLTSTGTRSRSRSVTAIPACC